MANKTKDIQPDIPKIDIKITREDNKLKFAIGKYELKLIELDNGKSQNYDFLALEQFITHVAQLLYTEIIQNEQVKKDLASARKWDKAQKKKEFAKVVEKLDETNG
jgi:uncharacterized iron-regulated protein